MKTTLFKKIHDYYPKMSPNQKKIANYLLENYDTAAFLTARQLSEILSIGESTVIRFATFLNYNGYPELQKALRGIVKNKLSTVERLHSSLETNDKQHILQTVFTSDIANIESTLDEINPADFDKVVEEILNAPRIYIISMRSAVSLGYFLHFYFYLLFQHCYLLTDSELFYEELAHIEKGDLVIGISFPRYSRSAVEGLKYAKNKGAKTIAITNSNACPMARYGDHVLISHSGNASFIDSFVAPLSLINALIIAVGEKENKRTTSTLKELEEIWAKFKVYQE